jgi:DNA-binding HxlR family transcriptional regulator
VRELLLGPKRFTDLRRGLPHAKPSVISQRLRELEEHDIVHRRRLGPPASTWVYELTDSGRELEPVIVALGRWGRRRPMPSDAADSPDSLVLALKWRNETVALPAPDGIYTLILGDDDYRIAITKGQVDVQRHAAADPVAVIKADPRTLEAVVFESRDPDDAVRAGDLIIDGDRVAAEQLMRSYTTTAPG